MNMNDKTLYEEAIQLHPELAALPQPHLPNPEDDIVDQILDVINAQTWFAKWGEIMMEYTVEGEDKEEMRKRCECSLLWLERANWILNEFATTEDRVHKKIALLRELLWITTYPYFNDFQREHFVPVWNLQVIRWAQQV
jgi:hypothetical protein